MERRTGMIGREAFEHAGAALGIALPGDVGAAQLIGRIVGILAFAGLHDAFERRDLLLGAVQQTERHGALVAGVVAFGAAPGRGLVVAGQGPRHRPARRTGHRRRG